MKLEERIKAGITARLSSPGYGSCGRCGRPWNICKSHSTRISNRTGCFALCVDCWVELTPEDRLPFYEELWLDWQTFGLDEPWDDLWEDIKKAVLAGN